MDEFKITTVSELTKQQTTKIYSELFTSSKPHINDNVNSGVIYTNLNLDTIAMPVLKWQHIQTNRN